VIIDTNVNISRWPFRRLAGDETPDLVARLRKQNVVQAWAGNLDGIMHKDIGGVNARLAAECSTHGKGILAPFGSINPKLPDWQEDVRRCAKDYRMPGIRLHPNYHGYDLKDPVFGELLHLAGANGLIVQLVVAMEDIRTQHPLLRVPPVDLGPLAQVVSDHRSTRLHLLNWWPVLRVERIGKLADAGEIYFDIAMLEGIEGVARLVQEVPAGRVLFGSHSPLFYFEAALLKMQESGLPDVTKAMVFEGNARRILSSKAAAG
jgi:predicted TIM-barrel fold metal-dependent hydrolase